MKIYLESVLEEDFSDYGLNSFMNDVDENIIKTLNK